MVNKSSRLANARALLQFRPGRFGINHVNYYRYAFGLGIVGEQQTGNPDVHASDLFDAAMEHYLKPEHNDQLYTQDRHQLDRMGLLTETGPDARKDPLFGKLRSAIQTAIVDAANNRTVSDFRSNPKFSIWIYYDTSTSNFKHCFNTPPSRSQYPQQFRLTPGLIMDYAYTQGATHETPKDGMGTLLSRRIKDEFRTFTNTIDDARMDTICNSCQAPDQQQEPLMQCYLTGLHKGAAARTTFKSAGNSVDHLSTPTKFTILGLAPAASQANLTQSP